MSFVKFLQGALEGATEQMPAAFERHDARKKFEQQMQMQQSQFASELGLKQQEVNELGRRNVILEEYNRDQLAFNEKLEDARQRGETRQMMTNYITSTKTPSQLEAIDLSSFHPENVSFLQPLIDAHRQGLAYEDTVQMQAFTDRLLVEEASAFANKGEWEAAISAANQLSKGSGQFVKILDGRRLRGEAHTPYVEMNLQLWNDSEDAAKAVFEIAAASGEKFTTDMYHALVSTEFDRRRKMAGTYREPVVEPPPADSEDSMDAIIPTGIMAQFSSEGGAGASDWGGRPAQRTSRRPWPAAMTVEEMDRQNQYNERTGGVGEVLTEDFTTSIAPGSNVIGGMGVGG